MANDVELKLGVDNRDAIQALDEFESKAKETSRESSGAFDAIKAAAAGLAAIFAAHEVIDFFKAGIEAANAQEKAMAALGQQLKLTGQFSQAALDDFKAFADEMEKTSSFADDVVLSQVAVAKSFGVSNEQAKKLTKAAIELSAATGQSLETSVQSLGKTFAGVTGKLDEQIPALKGMTKEALATGKAIDIVLERFGGSSAAEIDTFSGAVKQAENAFSNFQESIGTIIINNKSLIELIKVARDVFGKLEDAVNNNKEALDSLVTDGVQAFVVSVDVGIEVVGFFARALEGLFGVANTVEDGLISLVSTIADVGAKVGVISQSTADDLDRLAQASISSSNEQEQSFVHFNEQFEGFQHKVQDAAQRIIDADNKVGDSAKKAADKRFKAFKADPFAGQDLGESSVPETQGVNKSLRDIPNDLGDKVAKEIQEALHRAGPIDLATNFDSKDALGEIKDRAGTAGATIATSFLSNLGNGKEGARQFVASVGGAIADAFAPGAGGAVAQVLQLLGQDPEAFRAAIDGFVRGIPEIIDNIVQNIPYLVQTLADHSGEIITALVAMTPKIAIALAEAMPGVAKALADQIGAGLQYQIGQFNQAGDKFQEDVHNAGTVFADQIKDIGNRLGDYFKVKIPEIGDAFASKVSQAGEDFLKSLVDGAQQVLDAITPHVSTGKGGVLGTGKGPDRGPITKIKGSPIATGLDSVPAGFPNDSFAAALTTGERVVQVDANKDLTSFLARANSGFDLSSDSLTALARMISAALGGGGGDTVIELTLDGQTLARKILKLNQQNARLA